MTMATFPDPPETPGSAIHRLLIEAAIPDWLKQATPQQRQVYYKSSQRSLDSATRSATVMARLQSPLAFCEPLLNAALAREYPQLHLDARGHELVCMTRESDRLVPRRMTLLEAAMHNFEPGEALSGGIEAGSVILPVGELHYGLKPGATRLTDTQYSYAESRRVALAVEDFGAFCRRLDLGRQYVEHFQAVFQPLSTINPSRDQQQSDIAAALQFNISDTLDVLAHEALLKGDLTAQAYQLLLQAFLPAKWASQSVQCCQLRMLATSLREGYSLSGMMLVERTDGSGECVVYMPGEPKHPLKRYDSLTQFAEQLREKLRRPDYQVYFQRFVAQDVQAVFFERLNATLTPEPLTLPLQFAQPAQPDPNADIGVRKYPVQGTLRWLLYQQLIMRIGEDAQALVVPTGNADRKAREARIQRYLARGLNTLNVAAFFVPGVGELMAAVGLVQLVKDVCVGVDDWQHGQTGEAFEHFAGVVENVALIAGSVAAGVALGRSAFVEALVPVVDGAGRQRLWYADLAPYRSDVQLPDTLQTNALGQYEQGGRHYVRIDQHLYEQHFDLAAQQWQLLHPRDAQAYAPLLEHDGAGSWRHVHEQPGSWQGAELMRRFGYPSEGLNDETLQAIRQIGDVSEARLRQMLADRQPLPASLRDALERYQAQQQITAQGGALSPQASRQLIEQACEQRQPALDASAKPLIRDFPTLSQRLANELAAQADTVEHAGLLSEQRVPLRLAEAARLRVRQVRLSRACEGLHSPLLATADSDRLALGLLEHLPGWTGEVRLELRGAPHAVPISVGAQDAAQFKYLVRDEGLYQAFDAQDQQLSSEQGLFAVLLAALPDSERKALDLRMHEGDRLARRLLLQALNDRERAAQILGQQPIKPWVRLPLREGAQLGYPLSGRGALPGRSTNVTDMLNRLYPGLNDEQAEAFLQSLGVVDHALELELVRRQTEWSRLDEQLRNWHAQAADSPRLHFVRGMAEREIRRCWQRQTERISSAAGGDIGFLLDLKGLPVGEWPALSADFSHVAELNLNRGELREVPEAFLRSFPRLRRLRLNQNQLGALPRDLTALANLTRLDLGANRIVLDLEAMQRLADLTHLRILRLDDNPLGLLPDVSQMSDLRGLYLRGTGARTWPPGVLNCERLEALDLRDNQIIVIPDGVLSGPAERAEAVAAINRVTVLTNNPLSQRSMALLSVYRLERRMSFGLPALRVRRPSEVGLRPVDQGAPLWLQQVPAAEQEARTQAWNALRAEPGGEAFFNLIEEQGTTADFMSAYPQLRERVWNVIHAAQADTELREQLFYSAGHTRTCADGVALVFSNLEVQVLVHQAMTIDDARLAQSRLLQLARGLFRLDQVEVVALADIAARTAAVDEVEVRLFYRQGLAERLDLPGQPRHIRFGAIAGVDQGRLKQVAADILSMDDSPAMLESMVNREFWVEHLKRSHRERFERLNAGYHKLDEALQADAAGMSDAQYLGRTQRMQVRRSAEERRLIEELTREALAGEVEETAL
jgi:hypothetical protein